MPNALYGLDASFPQFGRGLSQEQKISMIYDYLIQVQESLRYTLSNLGGDNFNDTELMLLGQTIREPVTLELRGVEGELMYLQAGQEGLETRMTDAEGNIAGFEFTAQGLSGRLEDAEGNISNLETSAEGFKNRLSDAEGNISDLKSSAKEFGNRMSDTEGNVSALQQWAKGFSFAVSGGDKSTTLTLKSGEATLASAQISLTGMVTFEDLKGKGKTEINGSNIKTGKISALEIEGCTWKSENATGSAVMIQGDRHLFMLDDVLRASLFLNTEGWFSVDTYNGYSMYVESNKKLKLLAGTGMSLDAEKIIYIGASEGYATTVGIGNQNSVVHLNGTVYVNGVLLTAG